MLVTDMPVFYSHIDKQDTNTRNLICRALKSLARCLLSMCNSLEIKFTKDHWSTFHNHTLCLSCINCYGNSIIGSFYIDVQTNLAIRCPYECNAINIRQYSNNASTRLENFGHHNVECMPNSGKQKSIRWSSNWCTHERPIAKNAWY